MTDTSKDRLEPSLVRLILVLTLGAILALLDTTVASVGVETLVTAFGSTLAAIQWVSTGYLVAVAVAAPVAGWAVDRFGGRRMWLTGLGVFLAGALASGLAWDVPSLIATRVLTGLGGGMLEPIMLTMLAQAAGPKRVGRVLGIASIPMTMGPVIGPVIGGLLLSGLSWQWMFLFKLPLGVLAFVLAWRVVPRTEPAATGTGRLDVLGIALLPPGFAALMFALSQAAVNGFGSAPVLVALAAGVVLFVAYGVHALRTSGEPLIDLRLFANRGFSASVAVMMMVGAMMFTTMFLLPLYYQRFEGRGVLAAGLLLAPLGLGALITMPLAGRVSDRIGSRPLVLTGGLLAAAGLLPYALGGSGYRMLGSLFLIGLGLGFVASPTMGSVYRTVGSAAAGRATSALFILLQLGGSLGIAVVSLVLESGVGRSAFDNGFGWLVGAALVVFVAAFLLPGKPAGVKAEKPVPVPA